MEDGDVVELVVQKYRVTFCFGRQIVFAEASTPRGDKENGAIETTACQYVNIDLNAGTMMLLSGTVNFFPFFGHFGS